MGAGHCRAGLNCRASGTGLANRRDAPHGQVPDRMLQSGPSQHAIDGDEGTPMHRFMLPVAVALAATSVGDAAAATLAGRVGTPAGTGVAGAVVTVRRIDVPLSSGTVVATATTNANGGFEASFAGGCGAFCNVSVVAGDRVVAPELRFASAAADAMVGGLDFVAAMPATVDVLLRDAATGSPVASETPPEFSNEVSYNGAQRSVIAPGHWRFARVFPSDHAVCARNSADEYVDECQDGQPLPLNGSLAAIERRMFAEGEVATVEIALDRGATLTGELRDRHREQPIADASVQLTLFDFGGEAQAIVFLRTDASGRYRVAGLPPGAVRLTMRGITPHYTPMRYPGIDCIDDSDCAGSAGSYVAMNGTGVTDNLGFDLFPGSVLRGRVVSTEGAQALAGVRVRSWTQLGFGGLTAGPSATTGADGRFELANLQPLRAHLLGTDNHAGYIDRGWPDASCAQPDCWTGAAVVPPHGIADSDYDFILPPGSAMSGVVRIGTADPASVATRIEVYRLDAGQPVPAWRAQVAAGSQWSSRGFEAGTYFAVASADDAPPQCQVHAAQPCPGQGVPVDPATATPIVLPDAVATVPGIDFDFIIDRMFADGFEPGAALIPPAAPAR